MFKQLTHWLILIILMFVMQGCTPRRPFLTPTVPPKPVSIATQSRLEYDKHLFEQGYYKKAMCILLPLACDGNAEAQYAVGYMFYYGYGVAQDTNVGYFWIERAACQGFMPAAKALELIQRNANRPKKPECRFRTHIGKDAVQTRETQPCRPCDPPSPPLIDP